MATVLTLLMLANAALLTLYSYVVRLSSERGHFLIRGSKDNVQTYEEQVEPKLGITAEQGAWAFPLLVQLNLVLLGFFVAMWNLGRRFEWDTLGGEAALFVIYIVVFGQVLPNILLTRTSGAWLRTWAGTLRVSVRVAYPLVAISQFLHHIGTLGGPAEEESDTISHSENIHALMQAVEEEGLLEKQDRKLIESVVEFGDTTVREVMTPRPKVVAVPAQTTLSRLRQTLATHRFTRIPVYDGDLDHIGGFVHAGDLFAIDEADLERRTVQELLRPVTFVPETKKIAELLEELKQSAQIAIVIDEYGSVAGLATVEDLVEEIVGDIRDEHETADIQKLGDGRYSVPGGMHIDQLQELFNLPLDESGEATTVSGLVTDLLGRVPLAGERIEHFGLIFHISESNGRRVERLVITGPPKAPPAQAEASSTSRGVEQRSKS